jgi:hypothetical protein
MNKPILLIPALALSLLGSGCVGTGPNTQRDAVAGGTLGAIAGAVLGHNSRGGDALGGAILGGTVGAIAGGAIGNSVDQQNGTLYGYPPRTYRERPLARMAPPAVPPAPPVADVMTPAPAPNALWIPGYWSYDGARYTWVAAHWEMPPPNAHAYVVAHWENRGNAYAFIPSYWQ